MWNRKSFLENYFKFQLKTSGYFSQINFLNFFCTVLLGHHSFFLFVSHAQWDTLTTLDDDPCVMLMEITVLFYRLNWKVTSTEVWLFIRKLCITTGIMLMLCIILGLLMVRCLSLIWYVLHIHLFVILTMQLHVTY